ncbi:hypothetical protein Hanom_Chr01g00058381 [Helianthus anomalus]
MLQHAGLSSGDCQILGSCSVATDYAPSLYWGNCPELGKICCFAPQRLMVCRLISTRGWLLIMRFPLWMLRCRLVLKGSHFTIRKILSPIS